MGRIISSVVVGYVTIFVAVFLIFSAAYLLLGTDGSFQAGSWDVSIAWIAASILVGIVAAIGGGYVCAAIARDPRGPLALIVVVVVLGLILAIPVLTGAYDDVGVGTRPATVGLFEAMQNAKQPVWIAFLNPLLGAVGVMIGAKLGQRSKS
jgi:hypothetical protein